MGWLSRLFEPAKHVQPVAVDDDNFGTEVLRSEVPVLLDVWSDGCAPCRQLEPVIMGLAREFEGRVKVAEVNAERAPKALRRLNVRGTPTVIYFRKGVEVTRVVGYRAGHYHRELIDAEILR